MRALVLMALVAGGCMVDASIDTTVKADSLSFPQGGTLSGQLISESRIVPVSLKSPVLRQLSAVHLKNVVLTPMAGVHTLDFFRGVTLVAHAPDRDLTLTSAGPALLQPADDGSLTVPVDFTLDTSVIESGLTIEATIDFIVPGVDWTVADSFELTLMGQRTLTP